MFRFFIPLIILCCGFITSAAQISFRNNTWADSTFRKMNLEEKIGQLFMVAAWSDKDKINMAEIENLVKRHHIGGLIFFKGGPVAQANLTNYYQSVSKTPMLIGIDGEWGLSMRLDSTMIFPYQMALGALKNDSLIYQMGKEIARQCRRLGVHINFAPVIDVNNNPKNPVINFRSFGENKYKVAEKGLAYMKGMQDGGLIACAKHFPGHGDTEKDSHLDLPVVSCSKARIDSLEIYPFRVLFKNGLMSTMVAHLFIPSLDTTTNVACSISKNVVTDLLKNEMQFKGLVFTDALNMKGVSKFLAPGDLDVKALLAGNDILLYSDNIPLAISKIKAAVESGEISEEYIDEKVKKILAYKNWSGLNNYRPIDTKNLYRDLNKPEAVAFLNKIIEKEITLVRNDKGLIPLVFNPKKKIASIGVGSATRTPFQEMLLNYGKLDIYSIDKNDSIQKFDSIFNVLKQNDYDYIVVSLHNTSKNVVKNYGLTENGKKFINRLNKAEKCILVNFGNAYSLQEFPDFHTVVVGFEDNLVNQTKAAQILVGAIGVNAELPVSAGKGYPAGEGVALLPNGKISYVLPEEIGISSGKLNKIDSIVNAAIKAKATPGCQVVAVKDGKVFYNKSFGNHTYDSLSPKVSNNDIYDLASITKIAATTLAVMKLTEDGKINLDEKLSKYIKELRKTNKKDITVREVLLHEAGLVPFIPIYKNTIRDSAMCWSVYSKEKSDRYPVCVADNFYIRKNYEDTILKVVYDSELKKRGEYVYSDLGFILLKRLVDKVSGKNLDEYVKDKFYSPMGLTKLGFNPLENFSLRELVPTEYDSVFRRQVVQGFVHDQCAAMFGGVSGHAGLFSNARDLALLMQMLLENGTYAGVRYLDSVTVQKFTSRQSSVSRRGLGFDKPEISLNKQSPASTMASPMAFGHTGFTGTCVWIDPAYGLTYVFLSNRVHPNAENKKLIQMNVRTDIHDVLYEAIR